MKSSRLAVLCLLPLLAACGDAARAPNGTDGGVVDDADGGVTGPQVKLVAPTDNAEVQGIVELQAEVTGTDTASVEFLVDGRLIGSSALSPYSFLWDSSKVAAGQHLLSARLGPSLSTVKVTVKPTTTGADAFPTVSFISPTEGATICGTLPLEVAAGDDTGIKQVEFLLDGNTLGTVTQSPYARPWTSSDVPNGGHVLTAIATDLAGQRTQAVISLTVKNDPGGCVNVPPTVSIVKPSGTFVAASDSTLEATASDDVAVTKVQFLIDEKVVGESRTSPFRVTWNPADYGEGSHTLKAVAYDTASASATDSRVITIDLTSPAVQLVSPQDGVSINSGAVTLVATATDAGGLDRVEFSLDSASVGSATTAPFSVTLNQLSAGPHRAQAMAYDKAGNKAVSAIVSFAYGTGPSIKFVSPKTGETVGGSVRFRVQASAPAGIKTVVFSSGVFQNKTAQYDVSTNTFYADWEACTTMNGIVGITATVTDAQNATATDSVQVALSNPGGTPVLTGTASGMNVALSWAVCPSANFYRLYWSRSPGVSTQSQYLSLSDETYSQSLTNPGFIYFRVAASMGGGNVGPLSNELALNVQPTCATKYDCKTGEICNTATNTCAQPPASCGSDAQCAAGTYCSMGKCVFGCAGDKDCTAPQVCNLSTRACESQKCSDVICQQQYGPRAYCDASVNQCKQYQCVQNSDCGSNQTCDSSTHSCTGGTACDVNTCNTTCGQQGQVCAPATCTCQPKGTPTGVAMKKDGSTCQIWDCFASACVDTGDSTKTCAPDWQACLTSLAGGTTSCK
jgi:hypothetical protein